MNRYLKKIASAASQKDPKKLKRIGTGAAIGAGVGGAGAGLAGYTTGYTLGGMAGALGAGALTGGSEKHMAGATAKLGHKIGVEIGARTGAAGAIGGAALGAGAGYLYHRRKQKLLEKAASLLKSKRFVGRIDPKTFKFRGKVKDIDAFDKLHSLHGTVERQRAMGAVSVKHRLDMGDGSKAFIRATDKGIRSRLYRE